MLLETSVQFDEMMSAYVRQFDCMVAIVMST